MIRGNVNARREAVISLGVKGARGQTTQCDAIVDTGFNGSLALPAEVISTLQLPSAGFMRVLLGDGEEATLPIHKALIVWDGQERSVEIESIVNDALVGTALLAGHELRITFVAQGTVEVTRLP